jgi:hypothetical protein
MNPLWFLAGVGTGLALPGLVSGLRPLATEVGAAATAAYEQLRALVASRPSEPSRSHPRRKVGAATPGRRGRRPTGTATRARRRLRVATPEGDRLDRIGPAPEGATIRNPTQPPTGRPSRRLSWRGLGDAFRSPPDWGRTLNGSYVHWMGPYARPGTFRSERRLAAAILPRARFGRGRSAPEVSRWRRCRRRPVRRPRSGRLPSRPPGLAHRVPGTRSRRWRRAGVARSSGRGRA